VYLVGAEWDPAMDAAGCDADEVPSAQRCARGAAEPERRAHHRLLASVVEAVAPIASRIIVLGDSGRFGMSDGSAAALAPYLAYSELGDEQYVLVLDAPLIPVSEHFFAHAVNWELEMHVHDFSCCSLEIYEASPSAPRYYDLPHGSYIGNRVRGWAELLRVGPGDSTAVALQRFAAESAMPEVAKVPAGNGCPYLAVTAGLYLIHRRRL
jgi:hypothetical protein